MVAAAAPAAASAGGAGGAAGGAGSGKMMGGSLLQAGGSILASYMQMKSQEGMHEEEMKLRKKQIKHQASMDKANLSLAETQMGIGVNQDNRQEAAFTTNMRDDARQQLNFLQQLKALNSRYGGG